MASKLLTTILFLLYFLSLSAQTSGLDTLQQWWIPLSPDEVLFLQENKEIVNDDFWDFDNAQSFPVTVVPDDIIQSLPYGQYVQVKANKSNINFELFYKNELKIGLLNDGKNMQLFFNDTLGNNIEIDWVKQGDRKLEFHSDCNYYELNKPKDDHEIIYQYKNQIGFYQLKSDYSYSSNLWQKFKYTKIGNFIIVRPKIFFQRVIDDLRYGWRDAREDRRFDREYEQEEIRDYHPKMNGYIALNQPKFLPFDTLKIKGYFTSFKKNKPYNKPISIIIGEQAGYYSIDTIYETIINPQIPGRYLLDFVLDDSLTLDKNYKIVFSFGKGKNKQTWVKDFYLEEYELDEVEYKIKPTKKKYKEGEKIILKADALFTTGKRVPDVKMKTRILSSRINEFLEDSLMILDTLWTDEQILSFTDQTQIIIPDSIIPKARMDIRIITSFSTLNGELQEETNIISINEKSGIKTGGELFFELEDGYISGAYKFKDSILVKKAILKQVSKNGSVSETVSLPFKQSINPFINEYVLTLDDEIKRINNFQQNPIELKGEKTNDSLHIELKNKYAIPFNYSLYYGKELLLKNEFTTDTLMTLFQVSKGSGKYTFIYSYLFESATYRKVEYFYNNPNVLNIEIEQPSETEPGDEVNIKIKVKDENNKPVPNVELAAASISSKFGDDFNNTFIPPRVKKERLKYVKINKIFQIYNNSSSKNKIIANQPLNKFWLEKTAANNSLEYQLRFPEKGIKLEYIPLPEGVDSLPQFIPLIADKGKFASPYSVHLNREPIFYHDAMNNDFVFLGQKGMNDIKIRLYDAEIKLNNIELKKGYKLIISIDKNYIKGNKIENIEYYSKPPNWTKAELSERNKTLISFTKANTGEYFIWDDGKRVFYYRKNYDHYRDGKKYLLGPFKSGSILNVVKQYDFKKRFEFEAGFSYCVEEFRDKLYEFDVNKGITSFSDYEFFPDIFAFAITGDKVEYIPKRIIKNESEPFAHLYKKSYNETNRLQMQIEYIGVQPLALAVIHQQTKKIQLISPFTSIITDLDEGRHELIYIYEYGYLSRFFEIDHKYTSFLRIRNEEGRVSTHHFKSRIRTIFGADFDWDNSIFKEKQDELLGIKEKLENKQFKELIVDHKTIYTGETRTIKGIILLEGEGEAIGANVVVDGSEGIGTVTEFDGTFSIDIPRNAKTLKVSYTGFASQVIDVSRINHISVTLTADNLLLEVVVVGYGTVKKSEMLSSVSVVSNEVFIQKSTTQKMTLIPISTGNVESLLPGKALGITNINVNGKPGSGAYIRLRGTGSANATNEPLYIVNGEIVSASVMNAMNPNDIANVSVLKDEAATSIYGFSGANGVIVIVTKDGTVIPSETEAKQLLKGFDIRESFRDYAYWQPSLVTDSNGEASFTTKLPDDITGWQTYVLGLDRKNRGGAAFAEMVSYKKLMAQLSIPRFAIEGDTIDIIGQSINYTSDSFQVQTSFKLENEIIQTNSNMMKESIADNAQIIIPSEKDSLHFQYEVNTNQFGDGEKRDLPIFKQGITEHIGTFKVLKQNASFSFKAQYDVPTIISIQNSKLDVLLESIEYLKDYEYGCAEQTSSKLIALLLEKDLNEKLNKPFNGDKEIRKNIIRLEGMQNEDGSWGWWKGNKGIDWISLYVTEALQMANEADFKTNALENALNHIAQTDHFGKPAHRLKGMAILLKDSTMIDVKELATFDTMDLNLSDYLLLTKIKQELNDSINLDTIENLLSSTTYGGMYLENKNQYWYYDNTMNTLMAYDIFKKAGNKEITEAIELYFYSNRTNTSWQNTIHTAQILQRLLPSVKGIDNMSSISVNGKEIKHFPYKLETLEKDINITQEGIAPYFVSISQEIHFNNPKKKTDIFNVNSHFVQEGKKTDILKKSTTTQLVLTIDAISEAEYVMIEIPIPAGCSYGSKTQPYGNNENHREYFKDKVVIFSTRLRKGKNTFKINLEPRYTGKYTINPSKVEEMYAPTIFGRNEIKRIPIK